MSDGNRRTICNLCQSSWTCGYNRLKLAANFKAQLPHIRFLSFLSIDVIAQRLWENILTRLQTSSKTRVCVSPKTSIGCRSWWWRSYHSQVDESPIRCWRILPIKKLYLKFEEYTLFSVCTILDPRSDSSHTSIENHEVEDHSYHSDGVRFHSCERDSFIPNGKRRWVHKK